MLYEKGTRVESSNSPRKSGNVVQYETSSGGLEYYKVHFDGDSEAVFVSEEDVRLLTVSEDPWEKLTEGEVKNFQDFGVSSTYFKVENNANNTISSLKASRTLFQPHQFKPLIKFLNSVSKRILIADEVGLGKTIEAGHILLEMYSRKEIKSALVICPKSLVEKWENELFEKFGFEFRIYEAKELAKDIQTDSELHRKSILGIITYDKLKNAKLSEVIDKTQYHFDLTICDEAHFLRNNDTDRYKAVKPVIQNSRYSTLLTATPICNKTEDLFNILHILEPQRYSNLSMYLNDLEVNKPFVKALNSLNRNQPYHEVLMQVENTQVEQQYSYGDEKKSEISTLSSTFGEDPLFKRVIEELKTGEDTLENRIDIQRDLIELNSLNHIFTRTRKRDVIKNRVIRVPHDVFVSLTEEESECYQKEQSKIISKYANQSDAILDLINVSRQVSSSIQAFYSTKEGLEKGIFYNDMHDSKFEKLKEVIDEVVKKKGNKLIIFAYFRKTIRYLNLRISNEIGINSEYMDGSTENRSEVIERFRDDDNFKILISGSIGAEGLDMQFCDAIVNYDLPWNPMKIEQRIGRIDRIGQESEKIHIYNMVARNTIEEKIYNRLLKKIKIFEESLGDLESILLDEESLAKKIRNLEVNLYSQNLTEGQIETRIEQTARATIQEKKDLETIETDLQESLINDSYFNNEIERIRSNKRYVTSEELISYIKVLIREVLPSCNFSRQDDDIYKLSTPSNNVNILFDFINKYVHLGGKSKGEALNKIFYDFKRRFYNQRDILFTFEQDYAFKMKHVEFLNSYHPLIIAATEFYKEKGYSSDNAYSFSISKSDFEDNSEISTGFYLMAMNSIVIEKKFNSEESSFNYLFPVIADLNGEELTFLPEKISEMFLSVANSEAKPVQETFDFSAMEYKNFIAEVKPQVMEKLIEKKQIMKKDEEIRLQSLKERIIKQTNQYYDYQIIVREKRIREGKGLEYILKSEIESLDEEREEKIQLLQDSYINASMKSISISHLEVTE